jgi:hypothetical protein
MKHDEIATKKIIELAALANDGDAATEYVRLALGIRTRDVAGVCPDAKDWARATPVERIAMIIRWFDVERAYGTLD